MLLEYQKDFIWHGIHKLTLEKFIYNKMAVVLKNHNYSSWAVEIIKLEKSPVCLNHGIVKKNQSVQKNMNISYNDYSCLQATNFKFMGKMPARKHFEFFHIAY